MKFLQSFFNSSTVESVFRGGYAAVKNQPQMAPVALGGGLVAGVVAMLIGGYKVADCIRYQTSPGQCDKVIEANMPAMVGGVAVFLTGWGGFNTYNEKLRQPNPSPALPTPEFVVKEKDQIEDNNQSSRVDPILIRAYYEVGATQEETAKHFGVSRHYVQKALRQTRNLERGR